MNVLIHTGPGIGDILQKLPMASAVKAQYPDANVDFIMNGLPQNCNINTQILECQHYVRNLYWYNVKYKWHCVKLLFQLRNNHYDRGFVRDGGGYIVNEKNFPWIFRILRWSGVKNYINTFTDIPDTAHFIERDRFNLNAAGITAPMKLKTLDEALTDYNFENCEKLREAGKVIALSVGTNVYTLTDNGKTINYDVKSWAYEKWRELALRLADNGFTVALLGGKKEQTELAEKNIIMPEGERIINFIGRTTLKQSLALLSMCSLVVGAEGGMLHCASGLGVKTLTIFGGSDYRVWRPAGGEIVTLGLECAPCFGTKRATECKYHRCLEDMTVDMVFNKIMML